MRFKLIFLFSLIFLLFSFVYGEDWFVQSDLITGYNFLFSKGETPYYRSHNDLSDGYCVDEFHFVITPKNGKRWFDRMQVDASLANRIDSDKSIFMNIEKFQRFSLKLRYSYSYDFFWDSFYNYGYNDRDLKRSNLKIDFQWKVVKHFLFNLGYNYVISKGDIHSPYTNWGDIFSIPFNRHNTREEFKVGTVYTNGNFMIGFDQSWINYTDDSRYRKGNQEGYGYGFSPIISTDRSRNGKVHSDIPVSTLRMSYTGDWWSTDSIFSYKNGSIDNELIDLKSFYFASYDSRNTFLLQTHGGADTPQYHAEYNFEIDPFSILSLNYSLIWDKRETDTGLTLDRALDLIPTQGEPVHITGTDLDNFYFKNAQSTHRIEAILSPVHHLDITTAYSRTDGDTTQRYFHNDSQQSNIYESYSIDSFKVDVRYKAITKTQLKAGYKHEEIDHPLYRTAGDHSNEFHFSVNQELNQKLSCNLFYKDSKLKDSSINLDNSTKLLDTSIEYTPTKWISAGFGFTRLDLTDVEGLVFFQTGMELNNIESYDTTQNGYYAWATFQGKQRIKGHLKIYYLDDNGHSLPLSHWNAGGDVEVAIGKGISARLEGRYYDYNEDLSVFHNYSFNQLIIGLHWKK